MLIDAGRSITDVFTDTYHDSTVGLFICNSSRNDGAEFYPAKTLLCRFVDDDGSGVFFYEVTALNNMDAHGCWEVLAAMHERVFEYAIAFRACPHSAMAVGVAHQVVREGYVGNAGYLLSQQVRHIIVVGVAVIDGGQFGSDDLVLVITVIRLDDIATLHVQDTDVDDHQHGNEQLETSQPLAQLLTAWCQPETAFQDHCNRVGCSMDAGIMAGCKAHCDGNDKHQHQ